MKVKYTGKHSNTVTLEFNSRFFENTLNEIDIFKDQMYIFPKYKKTPWKTLPEPFKTLLKEKPNAIQLLYKWGYSRKKEGHPEYYYTSHLYPRRRDKITMYDVMDFAYLDVQEFQDIYMEKSDEIEEVRLRSISIRFLY